MKRLIVIIAMLMGFSFTLPTYAQNLEAGLRAGVNFANIEMVFYGMDVSYDALPGLTVAVPMRFSLSERLKAQFELAFLQKGFKHEFQGDKNTQQLNYLDIPLLIQYEAFSTESLRVFAQAGPEVGFGMSIKNVMEFDGQKETEKVSFDDLGYKVFDFGLNAGVGAGVAAGPGTFYLDARYFWGLQNINDGDETEIRHRGLNVGLSYLFTLR